MRRAGCALFSLLMALAAPARAAAQAATPAQPPAQPPAETPPAQPPAATPATPSPTPSQQVDADTVKRHLTAARDTLSQLTQLPAAAQLSGDARTQVSQLISNFNELITTNVDWRAAYGKVQGNLTALVGDVRIVLLHYAPIPDTLDGERLELYPFLGSYLLAEAIDASGADLVVHSTTKYLNGHSDSIGGIVVVAEKRCLVGQPQPQRFLVGRDTRDVFMSAFNHYRGYTELTYSLLDAAGVPFRGDRGDMRIARLPE